MVIGGSAYAESKTFEADPEAVRIALARGWVEVAQAKPRQAKRR